MTNIKNNQQELDKELDNSKEENRQNETVQPNENIHNDSKIEEEHNGQPQTDEPQDAVNPEEKNLEDKWLERILNHSIKTINEEQEIVIKLVKDIIDPETDIWFSSKKRKPIITEPGTKKLITAAKATFPKVIPIEKQSDSPSRDREQVWIEATVLFPNGEIHEEYGIANRMNCPDQISQSNLPIMARKRAMHRAFYRSDYIGLFDVYDENETLDARDEKNLKQLNLVQQQLNNTDHKYKKIINQLCKEIKTEEGELVWSINDPEILVQLAKGNSLVSYLATLRLRHINKKANN
ncbi:hypothetical protein MZM54_01680 [[Brevibacterium] frigoritolerans]|nr:hypothetical protein [Peribacillus frigoritolerans]